MHNYTKEENIFIQHLLDVDPNGVISIRDKVAMRNYLEEDFRDITTAYIQSKHNEVYFLRKPLVVDGIYGNSTRNALREIMLGYDVMGSNKALSTSSFDFIDSLSKALPLWSERVHDKVITHFSEAFDLLSGDLTKIHLHTPTHMAIYLGQVSHETGFKFHTKENLNYRCKVLSRLFKAYRRSPKLAVAHGRCNGHQADQASIANIAYANRYGNGNVESGDGGLFRGAGVPQLTFRDNYQDYHDWLLKTLPEVYKRSQGDKIMTHGYQVVSDSPHSVLAGVYFWVKHGVYKAADYGVTREGSDHATRVINRYTRSYAARWSKTQRAYALIMS